MTWNKQRATERIHKLIARVPQADVDVQQFDHTYMARRQMERALAKLEGKPGGPPILKLPENRAVLVDGVHIYANLINFSDLQVYEDDETELSHQQALQFLHLHYAVFDALVREFDIQRVDYHGARLHAVVLTPAGPENVRQRAIKAIAFAEAVERVSNTVSQQIAGGRLGAQLRVGIDSGRTVAINNGRGEEADPLFLGNPANYAAKLAAGNVPGVFLSDNIRSNLNEQPIGGLRYERRATLSLEQRDAFYGEAGVDDYVSQANQAVVGDKDLSALLGPNAVFRFHHHAPPLRSIKFSELMPSNTVRMAMVSLFADLDGFTAYVANAITNDAVAEMVARLFVMRGEMTHVVRDDYAGKKVRFVGDGLHSVVAEGDAARIDYQASVERAVRSAGALRSSFQLADNILGPSSLGLAIGIELGVMPLSRIGRHGPLSVRCATGRAVQVSEDEQQRCRGHQTAIGAAAYDAGSSDVRFLFQNDRLADNLHYEDVVHHLDDTLASVAPTIESRPAAPPLQAHCDR